MANFTESQYKEIWDMIFQVKGNPNEPKVKKEEPKQDWEIQSFLIIRHKEIVRVVGNQYAFAASQYLKYPDEYSIHSVKRLSDGEVFTVGDNIYSEKNFNARFAITKIELINNVQIYLGSCPLEFAVKLPKSKPEEPLPIKVSHFTTHDNLKGNNWDSFFYQFCSTKPIPTEKYEPIKKAIEKILSGEDWVMDFAKTMVKEMYANELLEAQKDSFFASRRYLYPPDVPNDRPFNCTHRYQKFEDYIKSLNKQ